jgi:hypothetical protein
MAGGHPDPGAGLAGVTSRANGNGRPTVALDGASRPEGASGDLEQALRRLELANEALRRENARLARAARGQTGSAAAVRLTRAERLWRTRVEDAEREAERLARLLATPRHQAVERARERLLRSRWLYSVVRRAWAWTAKG